MQSPPLHRGRPANHRVTPAWLIGVFFKFLTRIGLACWRRLSRRSRQAGLRGTLDERIQCGSSQIQYQTLEVAYGRHTVGSDRDF